MPGADDADEDRLCMGPFTPPDGSYLAALLKQVVVDLGKYKDRGAITDDTPEVHGLCFVLEKIFLHELKTGSHAVPYVALLWDHMWPLTMT